MLANDGDLPAFQSATQAASGCDAESTAHLDRDVSNRGAAAAVGPDGDKQA
jgi:hypothetical protein